LDCILFDVDGTLIDTGGAGARSWSRGMREVFGTDGDISKFTESGMTDPEVGRRTFTGTMGRPPERAELLRLQTAYLHHLQDEVHASATYRVLPGVTAMLERLRQAGVLLGLVSGNLEGAARIKIGRGGLNRYFAFGGYGSDAEDRAELTRAAVQRAEALHGRDLHPHRIAVVGDTPRDVEAARSAGTVSITVATGLYPVEQLVEAGADHVLATFDSPFPLTQS
jgi:phosphoglycolate phosphatase-like HAD superfamily hydrolase